MGDSFARPLLGAPTPSRYLLADLPGRVLVFLRGIGTYAPIRTTLAQHGFRVEDHREGWALLGAACEYRTLSSDAGDDAAARAASDEVTRWVATHFTRLRLALRRSHPERVTLFDGIEQPDPAAALIALATLLHRLTELERTGDPAAVETLAVRGLTPAERARLSELIKLARSAPPPQGEGLCREPRDPELTALYHWYTEWSATARAAIRRKDWLIAIGLAGRKRGDAQDGGASLLAAEGRPGA